MIRRYSPIKPSRGTELTPKLRAAVLSRDLGCVGPLVGMPGDCFSPWEVDHVRASHAMGMKSPSDLGNLVVLCGHHHRLKTEHGREWRPVLLDYIVRRDGPETGDAA